jgi:hypothetical protein
MISPIPLERKYPFYPSLNIEGERPPQADEILCSSISKLQGLTANPTALFDWVHTVKYRFEDIPYGGLTSLGLVRLNPRGLTEWTVVHELAHAWDVSTNWQISKRMSRATHSYFPCRWLHQLFLTNKTFWYHVGSPPAPCGSDRNFNALEDFAESLTAYVFPEDAHRKAAKRSASYEYNGYIHFHDTPRGEFIKQLVST